MLWNSSCSVTSVWNNAPVTCSVWAGSSYLVVQNSFSYYKKTFKHSFLIYDVEEKSSEITALKTFQESDNFMTLKGKLKKEVEMCIIFPLQRFYDHNQNGG